MFNLYLVFPVSLRWSWRTFPTHHIGTGIKDADVHAPPSRPGRAAVFMESCTACTDLWPFAFGDGKNTVRCRVPTKWTAPVMSGTGDADIPVWACSTTSVLLLDAQFCPLWVEGLLITCASTI